MGQGTGKDSKLMKRLSYSRRKSWDFIKIWLFLIKGGLPSSGAYINKSWFGEKNVKSSTSERCFPKLRKTEMFTLTYLN